MQLNAIKFLIKLSILLTLLYTNIIKQGQKFEKKHESTKFTSDPCNKLPTAIENIDITKPRK